MGQRTVFYYCISCVVQALARGLHGAARQVARIAPTQRPSLARFLQAHPAAILGRLPQSRRRAAESPSACPSPPPRLSHLCLLITCG